MEQIPLGTRVRTTVKSTKSLFRRSYDSPLEFYVIPSGATANVVTAGLNKDGVVVYSIKLEKVDSKIDGLLTEYIETIDDDIVPYGEVVHVVSSEINADILDMSNYPEGFNLVQLGADDKVKLYKDDNGTWRIRWNDETQAVIDRLRSEGVKAK